MTLASVRDAKDPRFQEALRLLEKLPITTDPSAILDWLVDVGVLRKWLDPLYGEIIYMRTRKGQQVLEALEADPYPDTAESGETYDVEQGGRR